MTDLGVSFPVSVEFGDFEPALLKALAEALNKGLREARDPIQKRVQQLLGDAIKQSPEYDSFQGGELQGELGVADPNPVIENVIRTLQAAVRAVHTPLGVSGRQFTGGLSIEIYTGDQAVLSLPNISFVSENTHTEIEWLKWLLTAGDAILIQKHEFSPGGQGHSRTGLGVMVKSGNPWKVPSQFAGVEGDNWFTKAFASLEEPVTQVVSEELQRSLA